MLRFRAYVFGFRNEVRVLRLRTLIPWNIWLRTLIPWSSRLRPLTAWKVDVASRLAHLHVHNWAQALELVNEQQVAQLARLEKDRLEALLRLHELQGAADDCVIVVSYPLQCKKTAGRESIIYKEFDAIPDEIG